MIEEALSWIDPTDREIWVKIGMAIHSELGDEGFDLWDQWSRQAENYESRAAKATWRSFRGGSGITIGSLYYEAQRAGCKPDVFIRRCCAMATRKLPYANVRASQQQAAVEAQNIINEAALTPHAYLASKGFPTMKGMVSGGSLVVPIRDINTKDLTSLQTIDGGGYKLFLKDGRISGCAFELGRGTETYLCEGYATGLSLQAALKSGYRHARVIVCFSAGNLPKVADLIRDRRNVYVVADNDSHKTDAGMRAAEKSGLPFWMPPEPGDANDFAQTHGHDELATALTILRAQS